MDTTVGAQGGGTASSVLGDGRAPSIARSEHDVGWLLWEDGLTVRAARRAAGAASWSEPERVAAGFAPLVSVDGHIPHVVWVNEMEHRYDVYYSWRGQDGWQLPRNVSATSGFSSAPALALAVADGVRFIAWSESGTLYFGRSANGNTWSVAPLWINGSLIKGSAPTMLATAGDVVEIAWQDEGSGANATIQLAVWSDGRWSLPEELSVQGGGTASLPSLVPLANGQRAASWREGDPAALKLLYGSPGKWDWPEDAGATDILGAPALSAPAAPALLSAHLLWVDPDAGLLYRANTPQADEPWTAVEKIAGGAPAEPALLATGQGFIEAAWAALDETAGV